MAAQKKNNATYAIYVSGKSMQITLLYIYLYIYIYIHIIKKNHHCKMMTPNHEQRLQPAFGLAKSSDFWAEVLL